MKHLTLRTAALGLAMTTWISAKDATSATPADAEIPAVAEVKDPEIQAKTKEQARLAIDHKLQAERLTAATNEIRAEVAQLKRERELMTEKLALGQALNLGLRHAMEADPKVLLMG